MGDDHPGKVQKSRKSKLPLAGSPPEDFQAEAILEASEVVHRLQDLLIAIVDEPPGTDLSRLHETHLGQLIVNNFKRNPSNVDAVGPRGNPWNRRFRSCAQRKPHLYAEFIEVYHDFVRSFVLEHLKTDRVAFQNCPTFRCHLPRCGAPGRPHRDEDYHHPRSEINFWIPLTPVFGSNSLYAESKRGIGDFRAFQLPAGKFVRFYGNQVWHYTLPNDTESTRVSIDFRVIREQEWSAESFCHFKLGAYHSVMTSDGLIPTSSPVMAELRNTFSCDRQLENSGKRDLSVTQLSASDERSDSHALAICRKHKHSCESPIGTAFNAIMQFGVKVADRISSSSHHGVWLALSMVLPLLIASAVAWKQKSQP